MNSGVGFHFRENVEEGEKCEIAEDGGVFSIFEDEFSFYGNIILLVEFPHEEEGVTENLIRGTKAEIHIGMYYFSYLNYIKDHHYYYSDIYIIIIIVIFYFLLLN